MNNLLKATLLGASLFAGSVSAAPIFFEATDVKATATVNYDYGFFPTGASEFNFDVISGSFSDNLGMFTPGDYNISFTLEGLWLDIDEDGAVDLTQGDLGTDPFYGSTGPLSLGSLPPLSGTDGALSWDLDTTANSLWIGFDGAEYENFAMNSLLASFDLTFGNGINGVMDANVGWDKLRVELNPVVVPEPSIWLLLGTGLLGLGWARRKA